jgi:hypothetical protein
VLTSLQNAPYSSGSKRKSRERPVLRDDRQLFRPDSAMLWKMSRQAERRFLNTLILAVICILLQTALLCGSCPNSAGYPSRAALEDPAGSGNAPDGDADCCASCFCCHFDGVVESAGLVARLAPSGFVPQNSPPAPLQPSAGPVPQPPRL